VKALSSPQRQLLRAAAHHLNPVVQTGARGLTDAVIAEADQALTRHELIKVKLVAADSDDRRAMADLLCERLDAQHVQQIGHIAILYRENRDRGRFLDQLRRA
tara:strand:- start:593 stop:901 length:309 start_codon:yes stop_codon:yes gene_type:complete